MIKNVIQLNILFFKDRKKREIFLIYFFLICGGIYNYFGILQGIMRYLAPYFISVLGLLTMSLFLRGISDKSVRIRAWIWLGFVFSFSIYIEHLGVKTGAVFGNYFYGERLGIKIGEAPLVIGFAWIVTIISSWSVANIIIRKIKGNSILIIPVLIAFIMVFMDFWMEPAAVALGYWHWVDGHPPVLNYLSWGLIGWMFAFVGQLMGIFNHKPHGYLKHIYIAQIIYFVFSGL